MRLINFLRYRRSRLSSSFRLSEGARQKLLGGMLTLVYVLFITPIAWLMRANPKNALAAWRDPKKRSGWVAQPQSTSQKEIYRSLL